MLMPQRWRRGLRPQHRPHPPSATPARRVLVLGTDARVVLAIARSLGRKQIQVELGWCTSDNLATQSRYVRRVHTVRPYAPGNDDWKQDLLALLDRESFDLVIPCNDSTVVPLQVHRREFERFPELHLHQPEVFSVAFDKLRSHELAASSGIHVPRGVYVRSEQDRQQALAMELPVIVKPQSTFTAQNTGHSNVAVRANTREELEACLAANTSTGCDCRHVQEFFSGTGVGVELLAHEGQILTAFQHQRIHETMEYGSSYRKSVPLDAELLAASQKLMAALRYTGVAMVEFIVNLQTGKWVFLEINGRFWGSLPLAVAAGADFPYYLFQYWVEGRREFPATYRTEVYCRNLLLDYQSMKPRFQRANLSRGQRLREIGRDVVTIATGHDSIDSFATDDPWPIVAELGYFTRKLVSKPWAAIGRWLGRLPPR